MNKYKESRRQSSTVCGNIYFCMQCSLLSEWDAFIWQFFFNVVLLLPKMVFVKIDTKKMENPSNALIKVGNRAHLSH